MGLSKQTKCKNDFKKSENNKKIYQLDTKVALP